MYYVKASSWLLVNETWGIAYGMVSYLKLAKLKWKRQLYKWMNDSTQDVTWWLEMVKIARKGFEVLSKGEGQATAWRPKNLARVKKEVLAFSWGTNQAMMVMSMWRIKSLLECLMEVTYTFGIIQNWWMKSSHVLKMAILKWKDQHQHVDTLTWWRLEYMTSVERDQLKRFKFIIIELIGMPYY